jgi:hypothetical protein
MILSMKKQTISIFVLVGCIYILQSCAFQPCTTLKVNLAGVNSRIVGDSDSWSGAFGVQAGADAQIPYNSDLGFSSWGGLSISMQGAGWEDDWGEGLIKGTTRLWYLNLPLVTRYDFGSGFYGEAGIQPGFLLSAKDKYEDVSYNYRDYIKTFDLGIPLGVGYEINDNFGVGFRVTPGLLNINKGEYQDYKDRNLTLAIRGTYTIPGK